MDVVTKHRPSTFAPGLKKKRKSSRISTKELEPKKTIIWQEKLEMNVYHYYISML
jgi:hypothetical protein